MKNTKVIPCIFILLIAAGLLLSSAMADSAALEGTAANTVEFYAYAPSAATLTFTQEKGTIYSTAGMRNTIYGGYQISWYPTNQPASARSVDFTGRTASISLNRGVQYTVRVTPYTMAQLQARDAYLGYPGTYSRWITPSEWLLTDAGGCQISTQRQVNTATPVPYPWYTTAAPAWYTATPVPYPWYTTAAPAPYPWYTATPQPQASATVYVFYRLADGSLITYDTQKLTPGTHVVTSKLNGSYFTPIGSTYQVVTVNSRGVADPVSVTFYYQYNGGSYVVPTPTPTPSPTPLPAASVEVVYKQLDGTELYRETRQLTVGSHMIAYDNRFDSITWLTFCGPASYNVTVYGNGVVSTPTITFYFTPKSGSVTVPIYVTPTPLPVPPHDESLTDQEAIIGADKIYPRPQPGKGKNSFNYEAIGQKVTVHSKALSLANDGSWWVCISGNLRCWGTTYVIDHEWIKTTYLNPRSYDLNAVPLDPMYK